jgi:tetratricopeptide (TPR) repeat protein
MGAGEDQYVSKKHRKPIVPASGQRAPTQVGPAGMLQEALRHLRRGNYVMVQEQVERVLKSGLDPGLASAACEVLAEAHFRAAMSSDELSERLRHLDAALQQTSDAAKLHFHRGIALWQLGRTSDAVDELDATAAREPARRGLSYLRALARIAAEQPWDTAGLTPAEANTVRLVSELVQHNPRAGSITLEGSLLGRGTELWQALIAMRENIAAAPLGQLKIAAEQNMRKPVGRILNYYRGVAALRAGDREAARGAWLYAQAAGLTSPALAENLTALLREEVVRLAQEGRWQDIVNLLRRLPDPGADRILAEAGSLAYYYLGYEAAQAGKWSIAVQHWRKANELDANRYVSQNLALAEEALENWGNAAEAWREMVRRRPRKEDHPDYLTDGQVAALWNHAAECYGRAGLTGEGETCLRNAIKYAPDDTALRMRLADALLNQQRGDAAETQLAEIVASEPQNVDALVRLGRLYETWWDHDPMAIWRQVLAVNPAHPEAREALADDYVSMVSNQSPFAAHRFSPAHPEKSNIEMLEIGLQDLPGHPKLLVALGIAHARESQSKQAREYLLQAYQAAPQDVGNVNSVLHELLHADAGDAIESLVPAVRQIPRLLPAFWFDQATMALHCKFGEEWADFFLEEALKLGGQPWVDDTHAGLLLGAFEVAHEAKANALCALLEKRIREEVPASGAVQYIEAYRLNFEKADVRGAARLIREAVRAARNANDTGVLRRAEAIGPMLKGMPPAMHLERILRDLFSLDR